MVYSDDSRGRRDLYVFDCSITSLLCEQFCRFANEGAKISIKSYFMRSSFFVSVFSAKVNCGRQNYFHSDW